MLLCGICKETFSTNDDLRVHLEGHASELFDSDEEVEENEIKSERESDEESLDFDYAKEEDQLQDQREAQGEGSKESTSFAPSEAVEERRTSLVHSSNNDLSEHFEEHASQPFDSGDLGGDEFQEKEIKTEQGFDQDSDEGSLVLDCVKEEEQLQGQQEETESEGDNEESPTPLRSEKGRKRHTLSIRKSSPAILNCSKCSYKTQSKILFRSHMNLMHLNKYKCDHCPKRYPSEGALENHLEKEHKEEERMKLPEEEFFRITMKKIRKQKQRIYECLKCTRKTNDRSGIYRHVRGVHRKLLDEHLKSKGIVNDDVGYHKCTECLFKTLDKSSLKQHIKTVHQKRRDYVCDLCKNSFSIKVSLFHHMKRFHIPKDKSSKCFERTRNLEELKCSKCSYKTRNKIKFRKHMNVMHLNKHKCDHCPKRYPSKGHLAYHIRIVHEKDKPKLLEEEFFRITMKKQGKQMRKYYECLKCRLKTPGRSTIYLHIRSVHRKLVEELYKSKGILDDYAGYHKCTECFYKTPNIYGLRKHIEAFHQKGPDYICDLCKKILSSKACIFTHMKTVHIPDKALKRHQCSICSYRTNQKCKLRIHLNYVHLKIRKFTCDLCRKQYQRKDNLQHHIENVHVKKYLSCKSDSNCTFTTYENRELLRHILQAHTQ